MSGAVDELYRAVIVAHGKQPRNRGRLPEATHVAEGDNPLCGDHVRVAAALADERIMAVAFDGESCAVATASASLMSERVAGASRSEARRLADAFADMVRTGAVPDAIAFGELVAFAGVHRVPVRMSCATLPWRTLCAALGI